MLSAAIRARAGGAEEGLVDLLDRARSAVLARAGAWPGVADYRRKRSLRLTLVAVVSVTVAFLLAVWATLPLLALAPVLLGVPHVASDVRYLLARPTGDLRVPARALWPVAVLFAASVALGISGQPVLAAGAGCLAVLVAGLAAPASWRARVVFLALGLAGAAVALRHPATAGIAIAQGHNLIAVALAGWLAHRQLAAGWVPAALLVAGIAALATGACDSWLAAAGGSGRVWSETVAAVAPGGLDLVLARRWVAIFAFAQAVHYSAWLRVVPDALRASARPVSFRRSFALLRADLGGPGARAVVLLSLTFPVAACFSLDGARHAYVGLSVFHGYVELSCLAALAMSRLPR
jgi:hypothetical protein